MTRAHAPQPMLRRRRRAARAGATALLTAAVLLVGGVPRHEARATAGMQGVRARTSFDHQRHEQIRCATCHGTGERHRTVLIRTEQDCLACHHDEARRWSCTRCHQAAELPEPGTVQRELMLSVWQDARPRALPFGHEVHRGVECRSCHGTPITLAMDRTCGACHEAHHPADAVCATCHEPPPASAHGPSAHLSCSGGSCHAATAAPAPVLSRALCLACHEAQRTHKPEGSCARCHQVPAPRAAPASAQRATQPRTSTDGER